MAQDNTIIKLPSGIEAEIRAYVRRKDESRVENAAFGNEDAKVSASDGGSREIRMRIDMASVETTKVWTMLVRLGDNTNPTFDDVEELRSEDFAAILKVVDPMISSGFDIKAEKAKK